MKQQAEVLLDKYKDMTVEAFKERLIHQHKLVLLQEMLQAFDGSEPLELLKTVLTDNWHKFHPNQRSNKNTCDQSMWWVFNTY